MKMRPLDFLLCFDWITPTWMIGEMVFARMKPLELLDTNGFSGGDVKRILKEHGVQASPIGSVFGGRMDFNVKDPERAAMVLAQYGIITDYTTQEMLQPQWPPQAPTIQQAAQPEAQDPVGNIQRVLRQMGGDGIDQLEI